MKKRLITLLTLCVIVCLSVIGLTACSQDHPHEFNKQVVSRVYQASEATCTQKATYYYTCDCGKKGTETFEAGEVLSHEGDELYEEWFYDETHHWMYYDCYDCETIAFIAEHEYENGQCYCGVYDESVTVYVTNAEEAQAALDNASNPTVIKLAPDVNYGVLYLRPSNAPTTEIDWIGNNYGYESYSLFENITIIGDGSAIIDAIEIEGGFYYHTEHSQFADYPVMLSLIELKNFVIDGVTFTGKGGYDPQGYGNAINLAGNNIKVNGLTLRNCTLEDSDNNARLLYKTESTTFEHTYTCDGETYTFVPSLKDIVVTGCVFNGGYMGLELRETENLTITDNVFSVANRNILLPSNTGCTYTGSIVITGNISYNAQERFVRADGTGDADVYIADNTILNYLADDVDYIKVTNGNNVTIENNEIEYFADSSEKLQAILDCAAPNTTIQLKEGVNYGTLYLRPVAGEENTVTDCDYLIYRNEMLRKVHNITILGATGATVDAIKVVAGHIEGSTGYVVDINNLVIDGVEFNDTHTNAPHSYAAPIFFDISYINVDGLTVKNCKLIGNNDKMNFVYFYDSGVPNGSTFNSSAKNITITGNTVEGIARLCELRQAENVTISDNIIKNTSLHGILLTVMSGTYSGNVVITGNTAEGINERFVRMNGAGDANIVITNNNIINYLGEDADYIKVTDSTGTLTVENNTLA